MKASPIIQRLRANCASFENRVAGAVEFSDAFLQEDGLAVPHAFVITGFNNAEEPQTAGVVTQALADDVSIVICVDNTTDDRGQGAADAIEDLIDEVLPALIGYIAASGYGGLKYRGGQPLDVSRARYWYVMDFSDTRIIG